MSYVFELASATNSPNKMTIINSPRYIDSIIDLYAQLEEVDIHHRKLTALVALIKRDVLDGTETYHIEENVYHDERTVALPDLPEDFGNYSFVVTDPQTEDADPAQSLDYDLYDLVLSKDEAHITKFIAARYISGEFEQLGEVDVFLPTDKFSKIIPVVESKKEIEDTYKFDTASLSLSLTDGIVLIV